MLGVRDMHLNLESLALWTRAMVAISRLLDRRTQCMSLSATTEHSKYRQGLGGTHGGLLRLAVATYGVVVGSGVVGGRRSRHRADVLVVNERAVSSFEEASAACTPSIWPMVSLSQAGCFGSPWVVYDLYTCAPHGHVTHEHKRRRARRAHRLRVQSAPTSPADTTPKAHCKADATPARALAVSTLPRNEPVDTTH